jgi:predicted dehydrogenase
VVEGERVTVEADDNTMLLTQGSAYLLGWDWEPAGVELWMQDRKTPQILAKNQEGYRWEGGGSYIAECLATGRPSLMTAEHSLHVLEVMLAVHESAASGRRVAVSSRFPWPLFAAELSHNMQAAGTPIGLDPNDHKR